MSTDAGARAFFAHPYFAVVGASNNTAKFGHKIFAWYAARGLPATPINPTTANIVVAGRDYPVLSDLAALPRPHETAVSVITPPAVTLELLREARRLGIPAVWLQPGTFDDAVLALARSADDADDSTALQTVVAGEGGRGSEGWCVLVDGDQALRANGKL
ncbi:succinyl CoA synthetase-like protein [Grosmannia clavigera kw1407]|uniref:Succinyl CoA synthetase-like protein n=1 Tax=Grosmannia clavigera (strain kw1407 / UAMH 11150) TaxID=655863 RepID=F0X830_GROCL|nr:succinyl CoA synthetase-like protein [Grosmannia clavigera kw1407]EFX05531.1 succinyl CoA synthetase-like protein [Grosmannia clavigera kw1407]